jgi:hypothetical protein
MQVSDASSAIDDASLEEVGRLRILVNSETSLGTIFYPVWSMSEDCGVFFISTTNQLTDSTFSKNLLAILI